MFSIFFRIFSNINLRERACTVLATQIYLRCFVKRLARPKDLANEKKEDAMRRIRILMMALVVACACNAEDITIRYEKTFTLNEPFTTVR